MKKVRSPLKQAFNNLLELTDKNAKQDQVKLSKPIPSILNKTHEQQHRRNTNSIKKVLKQLQDLKKDLNQLKRSKKIEALPDQLDNSKCRKLKAQTKRSSPSPEAHSHSSSRKKTLSNHKETSTQTKRLNKREANDFSFTIHQQTNRSPKQFDHSEQQDQCEYNPFSIRAHQAQKQDKVQKERSDNAHSREDLKKMSEQIQSIEAAQLYQRYLNSLKASFSMLEISSPAFTGEDKLKLNLELERLSGQIRRIPMHIREPIEFYNNVTMYARNLNNQLNNLAIILNRCENKGQKLKERQIQNYQNIKESLSCKNCEENQKKDWQRYHKREIKRIQKEVGKLQAELDQSKDEINTLTTQNLILLKEKDDLTGKFTALERKINEEEKKVKALCEVKEELQIQIKDIESKRLKQIQRNKLQEEDLNYYKSQIERFKKNMYTLKDEKSGGYDKKEQQSQIIVELKEKQLLYQSIIRDKDNQITDLKMKISELFEQLNQELSHQRHKKSQKRQDQTNILTQSPEIIRLRKEIQEKNRQIMNNNREIDVWKLRTQKSQSKNKQLQSILEQYTRQISRLHEQINALQEVNENYKDKYLKNRSKNEAKGKRDVEIKNRKQSAFQELNQLIRNHRSNIENDVFNK